MKNFLLILIIMYSNDSLAAHDVPIAIFHITKAKSSLQIEITFDLDDFVESLDIKTDELDLKLIQNYLDKNTSFQFNSQLVDLKIKSFKIIRDHLNIKGSFTGFNQNVKSIKVENTCLINVAHHSNVIQFALNGKLRDFRMHKSRKVINVKY